MKRLLLLLSFVMVVSCTAPLRYNQIINDIPTKTPNFSTEVSFLGEPKPSKPYFEVVDINISAKGVQNNASIRKRLELEAIKEGVDAIIDVEYQQESFETATAATILFDIIAVSEEETTVTKYVTYIRGTGIMYLDNLGFIEEKPEYEYFYQIDPKGGIPQPYLKIEYKLTGQEFQVYPATDKALATYENFFQYYSDFHLLHQRERWEYRMKETRIVKRIMVNENGILRKTVVPTYDQKGRIIRLSIYQHVTGREYFDTISYEYDDTSRIKSRLISIHDGSKVHEKWIYENDRLLARELTVNAGATETLRLRSSVLYYHPDFLRDYYFNEYALKQQVIVSNP